MEDRFAAAAFLTAEREGYYPLTLLAACQKTIIACIRFVRHAMM
jgi:hypothetical protein